MRYPHEHENDVIYFGQTNFRNQMRKFGIKTDDRRRHMYIVGKTGMGKTTLLENMILSDIYAGHGCAYIDPHGDTATRLLDYIPSWRINDVVYFNPADTEHPVAFNMLEKTMGWEQVKDYNAKVMYALLSIFKKVWANVWSARMEYILQYTILALLDTPGTTLLGINRMLSDKDYRLEIVQNIKDPVVQSFWLKEFASYDTKFAAEASAPIQNKVGQFLASTMMRNIVAQAKSSFNFRDVMDSQKILIVNLSKGQIGEDAMRILGGMLITKIYMSAMERVDIREEKDRIDFYLYVDEFQNFATESFADILSEARKYRLNLIIAHQYIAQLDTLTSTAVRDAVFGNVGSLITFRIGAKDAEFLEPEFMPRFTPEDLINLQKHAVYTKLMIDGVTSQPFSAFTLPPIAQCTGSEEKVVAQSRERFGGNRQMIEEHVMTWSGFDPNIDVAGELKKVSDQKKADKKARFSHEYACTRCGKTFMLPVELDRSRPIYCEECHPIVMEERKKGKEKKEERGKRKEERDAAPPQKVADGAHVERAAEGTMSLEALKKKEGKKLDVVGGGSTPRPEPMQHEHVASEMLTFSDAERPVDGTPESAMPIGGVTALRSSETDAEPIKHKRKRRRRNRSGSDVRDNGTTPPTSRALSETIGGSTIPRPTETPQTPVAPGERVTFDE